MLGSDFKIWLKDHLARHHRPDWPTGDESITFFESWLHAFKAKSVTPSEASEASRHLFEAGGAFPDRHLGHLLARIEARRKGLAAETASRRLAAARAEVEADKARERELRAHWRQLTREERREIIRDVKAENPSLARWPLWILRIALERAAEGEHVFS